MDLLILIVGLLKVRVHGQGLVQRHAQVPGNHLGDGVAQGIGQVQHTPHIPDNALCSQGTKGYNLHHLVLAVLAHHIVDYLLTPFVAEVNVDIRHGHTLRVQETLKEKVVAHRVYVGDSQRIGHNASCCGAPPRPHDDVPGAGVIDEIPHNQEVIHISHGTDNFQLIVQAAAQGAVIIRVPRLKALPAQMV